MAINVTSTATQQEVAAEQATLAEQKLKLRPKTVIERLAERGPASLQLQDSPVPVQSAQSSVQDLARAAAASGAAAEAPTGFELPDNRRGSPVNPADTQRQMQESRQLMEDRRYALEAISQREMERQPALSEIRPDVAEFNTDAITNDGFGESIKRSDRFTRLFQEPTLEETGAKLGGAFLTKRETDEVLVASAALGAGPAEVGINPLSIKGTLFDQNGFNAGVLTEGGLTQVSPNFARTMGLVTEAWIGKNQVFNKEDADPAAAVEFGQEESERLSTPEGAMKRGVGNSDLGRQIFRAWKREQNLAEGRPTDDYNESTVSNDQFEFIGTLAKEMYSAANPEFYERTPSTDGKTVEFTVTPAGQLAIKRAEESAPSAFTGQEIPPSTAPRAVLQRLGEGEARTIRKTRTTSVVNRRIKRVEDARKNMNAVSHIVDPLRRKIVYQLATEALVAIKRGETLPKLGDLFDIGPAKMRSFQGELAKKQALNEPMDGYDPRFEMEKQIVRFLEFLNTSARYSNRANHLDFVVQELQTRMHVAQNRFNPQGNPWMRFITGGGKPTKIDPKAGSEAHLMFKEMMAKYFIPEGKKLLPEERVKAFDREWAAPNHGVFALAISSGGGIANSLMDNTQDANATDLIKQIRLEEAGVNVPPALQQLKKLEVSDGLLNEAISEGLEGLHLIEAAHELHKYSKGEEFFSNMSVEVDGKTHGPSTNLMQLGAMSAAYRVGVLRREGATKNLDNFTVEELYNGEMVEREAQAGDIRDGMKAYMLKHGQAHAENFAGNTDLSPILYNILKEAVNDRENFLKKPPMTLAYGQLLKNLSGSVKETVFTGSAATKIRKLYDNAKARELILSKARKNQSADDVVVEFLHDILADSIDAELHPDVVQVGQLLRANNVVAMMTNEVMTIKNAIGSDVYIGAKHSEIMDEKGVLSLQLTKDGRPQKVGGVPMYRSEPAGSALREGRPGGWGRGRVIPAVIQGIDGAWMNMTFTDSWPDLKSAYMLPIMDAIKTDLANGRKVREHANRNWWKAIRDYSYVEELMGTWTPTAIADFRKKIKDMDPDMDIDITMDSPYRAFGWLLDPSDGLDNKPFGNLRDTIVDAGPMPARAKGQSVKDYENAKKQIAESMARSVVPKMYGKAEAGFNSLKPKQLLEFFDRMMSVLELESRNSKTITKTRKNREALFQATKDSTILQIDIG